MLRAARGQQQAQGVKRSWNVVVFSVGGMKLAARTEDVEGVSSWAETIPIPSRTPFVHAMLKRDTHVMPVYDLATRLNRAVQGEPLLCLVARHLDGPMAICIDADVPSFETVNPAAIRSNSLGDIESLGSVMIGAHDVIIVALQRLGRLDRTPSAVQGPEGRNLPCRKC